MPLAHITGWGVSVPEPILTNDDIAKMVDTNDEWMRDRTGIRELHIAREDQYTSTLAVEAAIKALQVANLAPTELDLMDTECFTADRAGYRSPDLRSSTGASLLQPRVTAIVGPFDGFTFSVSAGRGARSLDPQYVGQNYDTPFARVTSLEGGVAYLKDFESVEITAHSTFFRTHVDRDLFFSETEGRNTLAGGTSRVGWAGLARVTGPWFDVSANGSLVRATFDDTHLLIPYVPDVVVRCDLALFSELPWKPWDETVRVSG